MTEQRERILGCACDLFLEGGVEGFSMRKLAREVGVTAPAIYRHFESREELLLQVVSEAHSILGGYLYGSLSAPTPHERFSAAGEAYLTFALDHPRYYHMMHTFAEHLGLDELPEELEERSAAVHRFWDDRVRECMQSGVLRPDDPDGVGMVFWAQAHGLLSLYLRGLLDLTEVQFRELYSASFARILRGLASPEFKDHLNGHFEAGEDLVPLHETETEAP